jgi:transcriptional regulator with XRE-family HTH domain
MTAKEAYKAELARFLEGFGGNVRRVRLGRRPPISQERLSHAARLHRTEIGKIEQGLVEPRLTTLYILADALSVTVDELLAGLAVPVERRPSPRGDHWS